MYAVAFTSRLCLNVHVQAVLFYLSCSLVKVKRKRYYFKEFFTLWFITDLQRLLLIFLVCIHLDLCIIDLFQSDYLLPPFA